MLNPTIQIELLNPEEKTILSLGNNIPILSASWSLTQGADASQCSVSIPAIPEIIDLLLKLKLYSPPTQNPKSSASSGAGLGSSVDGKTEAEHINIILEECKRQGVTNKDQIAYILATAKLESEFVNFEEFSSGSQYEGRSDLGNNQSGDGVKFKGRGYVQLTGRVNYKKYSGLTGKDLISNPKLASDQPQRSYILVHGMKNGTFTGKSLGDYTKPDGSMNFVAARAIINGNDKDVQIAGYAETYLNDPRVKVASSTAPNPQPSKVSTTTVPTVPTASSDGGGKLVISVGEFGVKMFEFVYLLSKVTVSINENPQISLSGISPLWVLNQRKQTETKSNVTLKQLAELVAKKHNLTLEFVGTGTNIQHLENSGLTDYQLLFRECQKAGYIILHEGTKIIVKPIGPAKSFIIASDRILSFSTTSAPSSPQAGGGHGLKGSWDTLPKTKTDIISGVVKSEPTTVNKPDQKLTGDKSKTDGIVKTADKTITESQAQSEVSRVRDFPSTLDYIPELPDLEITTTDIIRIPALSRYSEMLSEFEYWVSGVNYKMDSSGLSASMDLFKPGLEVIVAQSLAGNGSVGNVKPTGSTQFKAPYIGPYTMTSPFGPRGGRFHGGVDLAATGSDLSITASRDGVVKDVERGCVEGDTSCGGGYGGLVELDHGDGYTSLYAHLSRVDVKLGQQMAQGQVLGLEGNTGRSFGSHLHFEIAKNGSKIDPLTLIK